MPRIRQYAEKYSAEDFLKEIRVRMAVYDINQTQLAELTGTAISTLSKRMKDPDGMTAAELRRLVRAIKPDPITFLKFCGYETKDIKKAMGTQAEAAEKLGITAQS